MELKAFDGLTQMTVGAAPKSVSQDAVRLAVFQGSSRSKIDKYLKPLVSEWQLEKWQDSEMPIANFDGHDGPIWLVWIKPIKMAGGSVKTSIYAQARDLLGSVLTKIKNAPVVIDAQTLNAEALSGALVGMSLAQYDYRGRREPLQIHLNGPKGVGKAVREKARTLAAGTNLARFLVDSPPNFLQPESYAKGVQKLFQKVAGVKVEIWNHERLTKENMGLHMGVGQAAEQLPCLVHIKYRPQGATKKTPIAFVGKGITFDSGGLDIKPVNGMRNMKKDMGGSAAVCGLAYYMAHAKIKQPADFYLALAENAISSNAFRPGDILTSRSGKTVEIHNTDAEGRLVMADAIDVAVSKKPRLLIDVATLTGAIKVGLGADVGGLFSNDDSLAQKIQKASYSSGDPFWQMPLYRGYRPKFYSAVADFTNAVDGFGGAINAALFLENFVGDVPWAHLDIYAWTDKATGALADAGGSGQAVQCLAHFLDGSS